MKIYLGILLLYILIIGFILTVSLISFDSLSRTFQGHITLCTQESADAFKTTYYKTIEGLGGKIKYYTVKYKGCFIVEYCSILPRNTWVEYGTVGLTNKGLVNLQVVFSITSILSLIVIPYKIYKTW